MVVDEREEHGEGGFVVETVEGAAPTGGAVALKLEDYGFLRGSFIPPFRF